VKTVTVIIKLSHSGRA